MASKHEELHTKKLNNSAPDTKPLAEKGLDKKESRDYAAEKYEQSHKLFISYHPWQLFCIAAVPGALSMLSSAIYEIADGIFVGQILGEEAFAAINLAMPFVIMLFAFGDMVGVGSSVPISISLGAKKRDRANNIFTCAVLMILVGASVIGALFWVLAPWMMELMGATGSLRDMASDYLRMFALFAPFGTILFAVDNYLRICGKVKTSFALNLFTSTFGCILEFTMLSIFHMGTLGAGLAFSIAISTGACLALIPFMMNKMLLRFVRPRISKAIIKEIMLSGTPAFLNDVAGRITLILLNYELMVQAGVRAVSVYGFLIFAGSFIFPLLYGICDALQPAVGYNWGAKRYDRIRQLERYIFATVGFVSLLMAAIMGFFPDFCTRIFIADAGEEILLLSRDAFCLYALSFAFRWFPLCVQSLFTAVERTKLASTLSFCSTTILPILVLFALKPLGLFGLWLNAPVTWALASALSLVILVMFRKELHLDGVSARTR